MPEHYPANEPSPGETKNRPAIKSSGFLMSPKRIAFATLIAVPFTAALTAVLLLAPVPLALVVGVCGLIVFSIGNDFERPFLAGVGGASMFAGVFAWALQQPI